MTDEGVVLAVRVGERIDAALYRAKVEHAHLPTSALRRGSDDARRPNYISATFTASISILVQRARAAALGIGWARRSTWPLSDVGDSCVARQPGCVTLALPMDDPFAHLLTFASEDPDILAVILGGGRGKGVVTPSSDWDCYVIVMGGSAQRLEERLADLLRLPGIDGGVMDLAEFRAYAEFGTPEVWDRYGFAHAEVPLDKTDGAVTELVREKGRLPAELADDVIRAELDAYVNAVYRSLKNSRDGHVLASRLDASESIPLLLTFLFALSGRVRPYNKFLEWELTHHPLGDLPFPRDEFLRVIDAVLTTGDIPSQKRLFAAVHEIAITHGLTDVLEAWGDDLSLLR